MLITLSVGLLRGWASCPQAYTPATAAESYGRSRTVDRSVGYLVEVSKVVRLIKVPLQGFAAT